MIYMKACMGDNLFFVVATSRGQPCDHLCQSHHSKNESTKSTDVLPETPACPLESVSLIWDGAAFMGTSKENFQDSERGDNFGYEMIGCEYSSWSNGREPPRN